MHSREQALAALRPSHLYMSEELGINTHLQKACNWTVENQDKQQKDTGRDRKFKAAKISHQEPSKQLLLVSLKNFEEQ